MKQALLASLGVAELVVAVVNKDTMVTPSMPKIRITTMRYTKTLPLDEFCGRSTWCRAQIIWFKTLEVFIRTTDPSKRDVAPIKLGIFDFAAICFATNIFRNNTYI
jgi:hypothetical protein